MRDLGNGRVDAGYGDEPILRHQLRVGPKRNARIAEGFTAPSREPVCLVLRKGDPLRARVDGRDRPARRRRAAGDRAALGAFVMAEFLSDAALFMPVLLKGLLTTILLTVCALAFSILLGTGWALLGYSRSPVLRTANLLVVNTVRGIPDHRAALLHLFRAARMGRRPAALRGGRGRAGARLFGLSGGEFPRRDRLGRSAARRGRDRARHDADDAAAPHNPAARHPHRAAPRWGTPP
ncbi:MAG: hypothetical protein WDN24_11995 [Sphingomonas sp.]